MYSILISFIMKQNKNPGGNAPGFLLSIFGGSVMEQADVRHGHRHVVFVGRLDDIVVADGAAGLGDVVDAAAMGPFNIVAKGFAYIFYLQVANHWNYFLQNDYPQLFLL